MAWIQMLVQANANTSEAIEDALLAIGAQAVTLQDRADQPLLEPLPGETPLWDAIQVIGLFDANSDTDILATAFEGCLPIDAPAYRFEALEDRDWQREWMKTYKPMQFGKRLWVCPSWCPPPEPNAINLMLDPGLAFGTGTHPTTALCLTWLDSLDLAGKTLLDYGCGSGILAVAGALLGCESVHGVDIDPQALIASEDNAKRNKVINRLSLYEPKDYAHPPCDVVVANILAGPLVALAEDICSHVKPQGTIALAGLLDEQIDQVTEAYLPWITFNPPQFIDEWACLTGYRIDQKS